MSQAYKSFDVGVAGHVKSVWKFSPVAEDVKLDKGKRQSAKRRDAPPDSRHYVDIFSLQ